MNIKVTGITTIKQLQQLDGLNIDFAGIDFYSKSPRYAGESMQAKEIKGADFDLKKIGMFVNESYEVIMDTVDKFGLDLVQLNGDESPFLCEKISAQIEVIKTFRIDDTQSKTIDSIIEEYDEPCDYYLFDSLPETGYNPGKEKFDWRKIADSHIEKPFFLSGGIRPNDAVLLHAFRHPDFFGVDINMNFEKEPGQPDMALVLQFKHGLGIKA